MLKLSSNIFNNTSQNKTKKGLDWGWQAQNAEAKQEFSFPSDHGKYLFVVKISNKFHWHSNGKPQNWILKNLTTCNLGCFTSETTMAAFAEHHHMQ